MPLNYLIFYAFAHCMCDNQAFLINYPFFGGCSSAESSGRLLLSSISNLSSPAPEGAILTGHLEGCNKSMQ